MINLKFSQLKNVYPHCIYIISLNTYIYIYIHTYVIHRCTCVNEYILHEDHVLGNRGWCRVDNDVVPDILDSFTVKLQTPERNEHGKVKRRNKHISICVYRYT